VTVAARASGSTREVKRRLKLLSNRYRGASVVAMRTQPIPQAYRAFFHQIGLDPDVQRIPSEAAAVQRLVYGGFASRDLVHDARLLALIETGVPVWALDADRVDAGGLGIRVTVEGDRLGSSEFANHLPAGRLAVADAGGVHALLFDEVAPDHAVSAKTERVALFAVSVEGVPAIHTEEALWMAVEVLSSG
jgi:DNA/RNA-binding domain of Phe-tRNA-synthetase-like protein